MQLRIQILAVASSLAMLLVILRLTYQRRLREEYSLLWLLAASSLLVLSIFGGVLTGVARFLGIVYAPSLLFAVGVLFVLLILLSQTAAISGLARRNRDLAQRVAILEWHLGRFREGETGRADGE